MILSTSARIVVVYPARRIEVEVDGLQHGLQMLDIQGLVPHPHGHDHLVDTINPSPVICSPAASCRRFS